MKKIAVSLLVALSLVPFGARAQQVMMPNPASDYVQVSVKAASIIILVNVAGEEVKKQKLVEPSDKAEIDVRNITEGVYLVKVVAVDGQTCLFVGRIAIYR